MREKFNEKPHNSKCERCVFLPQCTITDKEHCEMFREPKGITVKEELGDKINEVLRLAREKGVSDEMIKEYLNKDAAVLVYWGSGK